ncbi:MAG: hypothetical protein AB7Q23_16715 [Hyphomonadaceae bacterium]
MLALLVMVRDFLVAMALAWVGVTAEQRAPSAERCAGEACQQQEK